MNLENYALGLLSRQDYTRKKMREALAKKGSTEDEVDRAMEFLISHDLINDTRYADIYIESQKEKYGRKRLEFFLRQKGIEQDIIDRALTEITADEELESACRLVSKKRIAADGGDLFREKRKLLDFLVRKGFCYDLAKDAIDKVLDEKDFEGGGKSE